MYEYSLYFQFVGRFYAMGFKLHAQNDFSVFAEHSLSHIHVDLCFVNINKFYIVILVVKIY